MDAKEILDSKPVSPVQSPLTVTEPVSPVTKQQAEPSSKTSLYWDGYHSMSRGYTAYKTKNGVSVYADRWVIELYFHSMK